MDSLRNGVAIVSKEGRVSTCNGIGRFAIDLTALLPEVTGVDRYMIQLVLHLGKIDQGNQYRIYVNWEDRNRFRGLLSGNFHIVPLCLRPRPIRLLFQQVILPAVVGWWSADILHSPSFIMPMIRGSQYHVLTIHDMTPFSLPGYHIPLRRSLPYRQMVLWSIRRSHMITVPSRWTLKEIYHFIPDLPKSKVRVIPAGIGEEFKMYSQDAIQRTRRRLGLPTSYILYVGTIEPRKNLYLLVRGYKRLVEMRGSKEHLVLVGRLGWGYEDLLTLVGTPELRDRVHLVGYAHQKDLPLIYAGATLFVYPSVQEGFGFPPLEAMACGVPTISSQTSSLGENLEGAAILVPPHDEEQVTEAMHRLLTDIGSQEKYRQAGLERASRFRWEVTAGQTLECYQGMVMPESSNRIGI